MMGLKDTNRLTDQIYGSEHKSRILDRHPDTLKPRNKPVIKQTQQKNRKTGFKQFPQLRPPTSASSADVWGTRLQHCRHRWSLNAPQTEKFVQRGGVCVYACACSTFILEEVAAVGCLAGGWCGCKPGQHGEVGGAVGAGGQGVEGVVVGPPRGALIWGQVWGCVLNEQAKVPAEMVHPSRPEPELH